MLKDVLKRERIHLSFYYSFTYLYAHICMNSGQHLFNKCYEKYCSIIMIVRNRSFKSLKTLTKEKKRKAKKENNNERKKEQKK